MLRIVSIVLLLFATQIVFSQKMFEQQETICPLKFIMEDDETIIYYEPGDSIMVLDLLAGLEQKHVDKLKGVVMMQVMVDTIHQICCVSYTNKTNISDKRFNIPGQLINMTGWKRLSNVLPEENLCALINVIFDKDDYIVIRTGYNRNTGKRQLGYETFKRRLELQLPDSIPMEK
jgi:hypothetical protein